MLKSALSQSSEFSGLNRDEIKRVMSVIERDFQLRQKEYQRIQELKKVIHQEHQRVEHLANSKEFNSSRCIRCFKPFKIFFYPKELCSLCQLYVCHDCSIFNKQMKTWECQVCLKLKELESLTADWFYNETEKKYKRCGSAKVVHELYKRDKELAEIDEDLGYGPSPKRLSTDSKDIGSVIPYVVHDKNLQSELNEYSKRLHFLLENLQSDLAERNIRQENLKDHQQQIASEISRARTAVSGPLRRSNKNFNVSYEIDLQNLLIHKTEEILHTNLQEFQKSLTTSNFDQTLAKIILNKFVKQEDSPKAQRRSSIPSTRTNFSSLVWEMTSRNDSLRRMNLSKASAVDEEDTEKEENDESQEVTPTESSTEDHKRRFVDTDLETIKRSAERVTDWKINCTLIESNIAVPDKIGQEKYSTWL